MSPHLYGQLIYSKRAKNVKWGENSLFIKVLEKLDYCLTPYINAKHIKDLNVRPETIKLLEEIKGSTFFGISFSNIL